nr:ParB/RepB/Spo0J family partition protein [Thermococcus sp. Bubb.Bath]
MSENKLLVVLQEIKHGYDAPVIVIPYMGRYYILDGHHRAFALWKLGFGEVEALIIKNGEDFTPGVIKTVEKKQYQKSKRCKNSEGITSASLPDNVLLLG